MNILVGDKNQPHHDASQRIEDFHITIPYLPFNYFTFKYFLYGETEQRVIVGLTTVLIVRLVKVLSPLSHISRHTIRVGSAQQVAF